MTVLAHLRAECSLWRKTTFKQILDSIGAVCAPIICAYIAIHWRFRVIQFYCLASHAFTVCVSRETIAYFNAETAI